MTTQRRRRANRVKNAILNLLFWLALFAFILGLKAKGLTMDTAPVWPTSKPSPTAESTEPTP